jgi:transcriptional regulator with XRE-family HTH domain
MVWFFGDYLTELLAEKDWSASKLAKKTGLSHSYVASILQGGSSRTANPPKISLDTFIQLAKALQVQEAELLLAYKGINPVKEALKAPKGFDFYHEILKSAGNDFDRLKEKERKELIDKVSESARHFIEVTVKQELKRTRR